MPKVKLDEAFVGTVRDRLRDIRNEIVVVQSGQNPADPKHPQGFPLNDINILAGAVGFPAAVALQKTVHDRGTQIHQRLSAQSGRIAAHVQALTRVLDLGDNVELNNVSLADWAKAGGNAGAGTSAPPT